MVKLEAEVRWFLSSHAPQDTGIKIDYGKLWKSSPCSLSSTFLNQVDYKHVLICTYTIICWHIQGNNWKILIALPKTMGLLVNVYRPSDLDVLVIH